MPQATDIELAGSGYMLEAGSYKRTQDGMAEGRTGRVVMRDFFGGQHRAFQLERDKGWDSQGVGPAYGGQGVEPWGYVALHQDLVIGTVTVSNRVHSQVIGQYLYVVNGTKVLRSPLLTATSWASFTLIYTAAFAVTDLAYYQGDLAICLGNSADVVLYGTGLGALAAGTTAVLRVGVKARLAIGFANSLLYVDGTTRYSDTLRMVAITGSDSRALDGPIVRLSYWEGAVAIATRASLWKQAGRAHPATASTWIGDPVPFFSHGLWNSDDDYQFLIGYGGRLYTWLANQVVEFQPNGQRAGWQPAGPEGTSCWGATVAAGFLVVCLTGRYGAVETWAFDGAGWWLLNAAPQGNAPSIWPVHTGGAGDVDLITFREGSSSVFYDLFRLLWRGNAANTYRNTASFRTSLLDAGERDKDKAWRKVGATFAAPETRGNAASVDTVVLTLSYSLDGGKTYTTAGTLNMADPTAPVAQLDAVIANGAAVSRWLVLKLTWSSVVDWAPVLTSLWAEYELLDSPARRRRWSFKVKARDGSIQRDGGKQANTGRQLIADLWTAWQAGATVSFRDADYDDAPTVRNVRIVGIAEEVAKPADGGRWGEATLALTLIEV